MKTFLAFAAALVVAAPVFAQDATAPPATAPAVTAPAATDKPADTMQVLRDKLKADKKLVVAEAMQLTEGEAKAFWPVYDSYQKDLSALNDRSIKLIKTYADNYGLMSEGVAKGMVDSFLSIEKDRIALMSSYAPKLRKVLPEVKVARYYQVENKIRAAVNYELANQIPLAE
jgi:hypothetical protein